MTPVATSLASHSARTSSSTDLRQQQQQQPIGRQAHRRSIEVVGECSTVLALPDDNALPALEGCNHAPPAARQGSQPLSALPASARICQPGHSLIYALLSKRGLGSGYDPVDDGLVVQHGGGGQ